MTSIDYAIIILNYNTMNDAIVAAESVIKNTNKGSYIICIADNGSTKDGEIDILNSIDDPRILTIEIGDNKGYAAGNNEAIRFINTKYKPKYYIIMNPDVQIIEIDTLEKMKRAIERRMDSKVIGGQPLVWNCFDNVDANRQINVLHVPNKKEMLLLGFSPLRLIWKKGFEKFTYLSEAPYKNEILYHVPSGAFFMIDSRVFSEIGFFDEGTFIYGEEYIIGNKLQSKMYQMLFIPSLKVKHEHGKSIGQSKYKVSRFAYNKKLQSHKYYARKYLGAGDLFSAILSIEYRCDYAVRVVYSKCMAMKNIMEKHE